MYSFQHRFQELSFHHLFKISKKETKKQRVAKLPKPFVFVLKGFPRIIIPSSFRIFKKETKKQRVAKLPKPFVFVLKGVPRIIILSSFQDFKKETEKQRVAKLPKPFVFVPEGFLENPQKNKTLKSHSKINEHCLEKWCQQLLKKTLPKIVENKKRDFLLKNAQN